MAMFLWVMTACAASYGIATIPIDTTTSSFLKRSGEGWATYQESIESFGNDEFVSVLISGEKPYELSALQSVYRLSERLEEVGQVERVDSLSTVPVIVSGPANSINAFPPMLRMPASDLDASSIGSLIEKDGYLRRRFVSPDAKAFLIDVFISDESTGDFEEGVNKIREVAAAYSAAISGVPIFRTEVNRKTIGELALFVPITMVLVCAVIWVGFNSFVAVLVAIVSGGIGAWISVGFMGVLGGALSLSTVMLPSIFIALGCAYNVHVLRAAIGAADREALATQVMVVSRPLGFSGVTTAMGFLAMSIIPIEAIRDLSLYGAIGVMLVLASAITLAPALLAVLPISDGGARPPIVILGMWARRLGRWLQQSRGGILGAWVAVSGLAGIGIFQVAIETDIIQWFSPDSIVRKDYERIRADFAGITPLNMVISSSDGSALTEPDRFARIGEFRDFVESHPAIGSAISVNIPVSRMQGTFSGNASAGTLKTRDSIEQYLSLVSMDSDIRSLISDDRSATNVLMRADLNDSKGILEVSQDMLDWWTDHSVSGVSARVTGIMYEFARSQDAIAWGQIRGFGIALGAIALLLVLILRSVVLTAVALIPNLIPIAIIYGGMGAFGVSIDAATVCVGSIALGIAVDDTIHLCLRFRDRMDNGADSVSASQEVIERVSGALILSTVAIAAGFLVLGLSDFTLIKSFGLLVSAVVTVCLAADLTILPILLVRTSKWIWK